MRDDKGIGYEGWRVKLDLCGLQTLRVFQLRKFTALIWWNLVCEKLVIFHVDQGHENFYHSSGAMRNNIINC